MVCNTKKYRLTRSSPYQHACNGKNDLTARQGYYLTANDSLDALKKMSEMFPDDPPDSFTCNPQ